MFLLFVFNIKYELRLVPEGSTETQTGSSCAAAHAQSRSRQLPVEFEVVVAEMTVKLGVTMRRLLYRNCFKLTHCRYSTVSSKQKCLFKC